MRGARQGQDIMKLGIDFHQFTYPQLRGYFREVGFSTVMDFVRLQRPLQDQKSAALEEGRLQHPQEVEASEARGPDLRARDDLHVRQITVVISR